ncbi:ATP dependent DNA ligase [Hirsutella rhossiliensis]
MPFPFKLLCDLLNELNCNSKWSIKADKRQRHDSRVVLAWFNKHDGIIPRRGPGAVAFLPDRVFGLREKQLEPIIQRAQGLGSSRMEELQRWKTTDGPDFASCVEHSRIGSGVTLEELDEVLDQVSASSPFSSSSLPACLLSTFFRQLHSSEAKWLVRMILKNYSPVEIPERLAMGGFHFLLPHVLQYQSTIPAALQFLQRPTIEHMPFQPTTDVFERLGDVASQELEPKIGVMIGRGIYAKARSINHCCQLAGSRRMTVERKYDGEYCQVHIGRSNSGTSIKIFSKSGRDSTNDRTGIHHAIRHSLELDSASCMIKRQCIVEGELLVWNQAKRRIEPFHKLRKHGQRSGQFLGVLRDSPIDPNEHLMITFYDIMLLDNIVLAKESHDRRRQTLESLVHRMPGWADLGSRQVIQFSSADAAEQLRKTFARAISQRWEGLVLKGCGDPYLSFNNCRTFIKLKKDYIPGLGDTADFVLLGGRLDVGEAYRLKLGKVWWTSFYIGCVNNKDEPRIRIIDVVDSHGISKRDIKYLNVPTANSLPEFDVVLGPERRLQPTELFSNPFTVEIVGAGDAIGFQELQKMAEKSLMVPDERAGEEETWPRKLGSQDNVISMSKSNPLNQSGTNVQDVQSTPHVVKEDTSLGRKRVAKYEQDSGATAKRAKQN